MLGDFSSINFSYSLIVHFAPKLEAQQKINQKGWDNNYESSFGYPNQQEIENFLKLRELIKRKFWDLQDLVSSLGCIGLYFCNHAPLSLKRLSSRGSECFAYCFCLNSKLDSISFISRTVQECLRHKFGRTTLHRPLPKV